MESSTLFISFLIFTSGYLVAAQGSSLHRRHHHHHHRRVGKFQTHDGGFRPSKLFVFGDSYADTGNLRKSTSNSWNEPYGITFPGKPSGRFSDGRVLTDYLAKFWGLKSPFPYTWREMAGNKLVHGMNFAYGGSGVFETFPLLPNMTTQIDFFEQLINDSVYTKWDLESSVVVVCLSGNDYSAFISKGGNLQSIQTFIPQVVNQLATNLKRIHELGATRVILTAMQPLGCLPTTTRLSSYQQCNTTANLAVGFHNQLLRQAVAKLNNESTSTSFYILDLFTTFTTVLEQRRDYQGNFKFETPLKPCCIGINGNSCGAVSEDGQKMYTVCSHPESAFFWDGSHPTQAGWHAVYMTLKTTLQQFF